MPTVFVLHVNYFNAATLLSIKKLRFEMHQILQMRTDATDDRSILLYEACVK